MTYTLHSAVPSNVDIDGALHTALVTDISKTFNLSLSGNDLVSDDIKRVANARVALTHLGFDTSITGVSS